MRARSALGIFLLGAGTAWNGGNVGPAVTELAGAFSVSLSTVGLLSGTVLFGALVAASLATPTLSDRIGPSQGARLAASLAGAGNVLIAAGPSWGWLISGRVVAGAGLERQVIRNAGKGDEAFQLMVAVGAPAKHVQGEVDLGKRLLGQHRAHAKTRSLRIN